MYLKLLCLQGSLLRITTSSIDFGLNFDLILRGVHVGRVFEEKERRFNRGHIHLVLARLLRLLLEPSAIFQAPIVARTSTASQDWLKLDDTAT